MSTRRAHRTCFRIILTHVQDKGHGTETADCVFSDIGITLTAAHHLREALASYEPTVLVIVFCGLGPRPSPREGFGSIALLWGCPSPVNALFPRFRCSFLFSASVPPTPRRLPPRPRQRPSRSLHRFPLKPSLFSATRPQLRVHQAALPGPGLSSNL